jgi:hypothetical protein
VKLLYLVLLLTVFSATASAQQVIARLPALHHLEEKGKTICHYDAYRQQYTVTQQTGDSISRFLCDSNFSVLHQYHTLSDSITYNPGKKEKKQYYLATIASPSGLYELFAQEDDFIIYTIDFQQKKASFTCRFSTGINAKDEKTTAVMPGFGQIKILSHSKKENALYVTQWKPGYEQPLIKRFALPNRSLTDEEYKLYGDAGLVDIKNGFSKFVINSLEETYPVSIAGSERIYFNDDKIYCIKKMKSDLGFFLLTINITKAELTTRQIITNTWDELYSSAFEETKYSAITIVDTLLILDNISNTKFEYWFFNLNTGERIKTYSTKLKEAPGYLFNSVMKYGTGQGKKNSKPKERKNKQLFMDEIYGGEQLLSLAHKDNDSITITLCSFEGTDLAGIAVVLYLTGGIIASTVFSLAAAITTGNFTAYTKSRFYVHSAFSIKELNISAARNKETILDKLLTGKSIKLLTKAGSFLIRGTNQYYSGSVNKETKMLEIAAMGN